MNINMFLSMFGLNPNNFENVLIEPIKTSNGYILELKEVRRKDISCPCCGGNHQHVNQHYSITINGSINQNEEALLRINRIQYKCMECSKTFTVDLEGLQAGNNLSNHSINLMKIDFKRPLTFSFISDIYHCSCARCIQLFDKAYPIVYRSQLSEILCIDEIKFKNNNGSKYASILYSYDRQEVIDVIGSKQKDYLDDYFSSISELERKKVKYFVSDMFLGYARVHAKYFPNSIYIVDLFHVIKLMTEAVNSIRVQTMNTLDHKDAEYKFMKRYWKQFLCREENITDKWFTTKDNKKGVHYSDMVFNCKKLNHKFLQAHNILQDLYHYSEKTNYQEALNFINYVCERLKDTDHPLLIKVAESYHYFRNEIANSFSRSQNGKRITNSIAETLNNHIKTLIKISYGYANFDRFRRRVLIVNINGVIKENKMKYKHKKARDNLELSPQ